LDEEEAPIEVPDTFPEEAEANTSVLDHYPPSEGASAEGSDHDTTFIEVDYSPIEPPPERRAPRPFTGGAIRLKVAVDYHNVIQLTRRERNKAPLDFIPTDSVVALRRLAVYHDVYIYSFAGQNRLVELYESLKVSGITEIVGGEQNIFSGYRIPSAVGREVNNARGKYWIKGKAQVAHENGIDVLVDDRRDIGREAVSFGLRFIGVNTDRDHLQGTTHLGGVDTLSEAVDLILASPEHFIRL
jgi:hypothetical protein